MTQNDPGFAQKASIDTSTYWVYHGYYTPYIVFLYHLATSFITYLKLQKPSKSTTHNPNLDHQQNLTPH